MSALCAAAGVSRPTFYQHFATVGDVAVAGVERSFARLRAELPDGPDGPARLLAAFLAELEGDRATWQRTLGAGVGMEAARDAVEAWFAERLAEQAPAAGPVEVRYAAAGFFGAVRAWLVQDDGPQRPSAAELAGTLVHIAGRVLAP